MTNFEEEYEDVLQNIEFGIVRVYHAQPTLLDVDVDHALEGLVRAYQAEQRGRAAPALRLSLPAQAVYDSVRPMCEWRLGREPLYTEAGKKLDVGPEPLTLDEIVACLKRVRKSVAFWTKERGRQGYLSFVSQFIG